jgi:sulfur carrier protein ThiS
MAAAEILGHHGVTVTPTETFEDTLEALSTKDETTVFLFDAQGFLDRSQLEEITTAADRVVVVTPRLRTLNGLTEGISPGGVVPEATQVIEPGCDEEDALEAGRVSAQGSVFSGQ